MAHGKSKDLAKTTQSDKFLREKAFKIAWDPKYDGYQRELASIIYRIFGKKSSGSGVDAKPNYHFPNELHKQIIRKFKRRNVYSPFRDIIWGVDLADMQSLRKYNKAGKIKKTKEELVSFMHFKKQFQKGTNQMKID